MLSQTVTIEPDFVHSDCHSNAKPTYHSGMIRLLIVENIMPLSDILLILHIPRLNLLLFHIHV